jgi:uncharacterized membrane protein HdeD (DUF308 family)
MTDLALPRARARRRRLPRPPKFTRREKISIAMDCALGVIYLGTFLAAAYQLACLVGLAAVVTGIRATVMGALGRYSESGRAHVMGCGLFVAAAVLFFVGAP